MKNIRIFIVFVFLTTGLLTCLAKEPLLTSPGVPVMGELDPFFMETLYNIEDADTGLKSVESNPRFKALVKKNNLKLLGGPMLGCVTENSAKIWLRTPGSAKVQAAFARKGDSSLIRKSKALKTKGDMDYAAVLELSGLEASTEYSYDILVDGMSVFNGNSPVFRTSPAEGQKASFSVAFGGGARYISKNEHIWDVIDSYNPAAFLFLGDNVYIDLPESRTKQRVHYYRRQLRPEYQRLTSSTAIYAIYDDHDFGVNDCAGGLDPFKPEWKVQALNVFKENWVNPYYGGGDQIPGCWFDFSIGDVDFFMIDNRYYRSFKDGTMLGPAQKKWLLDKLEASKATFKVIASGTLWTEYADKGGKDSWWGVKKEREEIFSLIDRKQIGGVILLSADRHRSDVYKTKRPEGYDLYEFESSKLTNNHTHKTKEKALFSYNEGNFFGLLTFDLTKNDPEITYRCITSNNKSVYSLTLKRSQLKAK